MRQIRIDDCNFLVQEGAIETQALLRGQRAEVFRPIIRFERIRVIPLYLFEAGSHTIIGSEVLVVVDDVMYYFYDERLEIDEYLLICDGRLYRPTEEPVEVNLHFSLRQVKIEPAVTTQLEKI
ncbi:TPA: hypothetical protein DF272_03715 [Candidatus Falkowbacteria bacterium]|nr:hypothetical protein [Candidatus Falkowbacteria bacterium]